MQLFAVLQKFGSVRHLAHVFALHSRWSDSCLRECLQVRIYWYTYTDVALHWQYSCPCQIDRNGHCFMASIKATDLSLCFPTEYWLNSLSWYHISGTCKIAATSSQQIIPLEQGRIWVGVFHHLQTTGPGWKPACSRSSSPSIFSLIRVQNLSGSALWLSFFFCWSDRQPLLLLHHEVIWNGSNRHQGPCSSWNVHLASFHWWCSSIQSTALCGPSSGLICFGSYTIWNGEGNHAFAYLQTCHLNSQKWRWIVFLPTGYYVCKSSHRVLCG